MAPYLLCIEVMLYSFTVLNISGAFLKKIIKMIKYIHYSVSYNRHTDIALLFIAQSLSGTAQL